MKSGKITIDANRPSVRFPLRTVEVGRASAVEIDIRGVSSEIQSLQFHVGRVGMEDYSPVEASLKPDGTWSVYVSGLYFPDVGSANYHISGKDAKDNAVWIGKGCLEIVNSVLPVDSAEVPLIPEDTYVRNPNTGLWHKLTCTFEDGAILPMIEEEGITK